MLVSLNWRRISLLGTLFGATFLVAACNTLPQNAAIPELKIQNVSFDNKDRNEPYFVIDYSLQHHSAEALPLQELKASVFIQGEIAASLEQKQVNKLIEPNQVHDLQLKIPMNQLSAAAADSLGHSSLVILQGSCALQAFFNQNDLQSDFNPTDSFIGFIHSLDNDRVKANHTPVPSRTDLTPQASLVPLPPPAKAQEEQEEIVEQSQSGQSTQDSTKVSVPHANFQQNVSSHSHTQIISQPQVRTNNQATNLSSSQVQGQTRSQSQVSTQPYTQPKY